MRPYIAAAKVLVLPSYREGFPNVVLQALSLGRPVIVTDVSGANEIVQSGENGWVVPVRDSEALHRAMQKAMDSEPGELLEKGKKGRELVAERHERHAYWEELLEFYRSLLSSVK